MANLVKIVVVVRSLLFTSCISLRIAVLACTMLGNRDVNIDAGTGHVVYACVSGRMPFMLWSIVCVYVRKEWDEETQREKKKDMENNK